MVPLASHCPQSEGRDTARPFLSSAVCSNYAGLPARLQGPARMFLKAAVTAAVVIDMGQRNGEVISERAQRLLSLVAERDLAALRTALALLTDRERRAGAAAVAAWYRRPRYAALSQEEFDRFCSCFENDGGWAGWLALNRDVACAAVVGTFSAPAAAAAVLRRAIRHYGRGELPADLMIEIARDRGLAWLPDLAGRLADQIGDSRGGWDSVDQILRAYGAPAPPGAGFVLGWLASVPRGPYPRERTPEADAKLAAEQADWLQASPYLPGLLPRIFTTDEVQRYLEPALPGLLELSRRQPGYRPQLIDGCLRRILLSGTAPTLRPFGLLWAGLAPDDGEVAARVALYTAVAASAAPGLATQALKPLHGLAQRGELELDDLLDLSATVLARPEKALVNTHLRVLTGVIGRYPGRLRDILATAEPATEHGAPEVRSAAARMLRAHAAGVPSGTSEKLAAAEADACAERAAAEADARAERAAAAVNFSCPVKLPAPPRPADAGPLSLLSADPDLLQEQVLKRLQGQPWDSGAGALSATAVEPVLDGLVRLAQAAPLGLGLSEICVHLIGGDLTPLKALAGELAAGRCGDQARLVKWGLARLRVAELAARLGTDPVPRLVAVPTDTAGVIAPRVLLERLAAAEAEGWVPWPLDLDQALLRTTRLVPAELAGQAGALTSPAGRRLARWWSRSPDRQERSSGRPELEAEDWDGLIGILLARDSDPGAAISPEFIDATVPYWLAALPHHPEVVARWLSPVLRCHDSYWGAQRWLMTTDDMARLLLGTGSPGPGLRRLLAYGLGAPGSKVPEAAAGVLAELLTRPATDAGALGADLGAAFAARQAVLDRALPRLEQVTVARPEQMWPVLTAALPAVLAARHASAFRLVQIATDLAGHLGRTASIPGLAGAVRRRGRLGQAARELSATVSGAPR